MKSQRGFTLTELLLVVAIAAIGLALAIPQIQGTMAEYSLAASTEMMLAELDTARMMAVSRGTPYQIEFQSGSIQIVDPADPDNPPRAVRKLDEGVIVAATPQNPITFTPRGFARGGVFQVENSHGTSRLIIVLNSGRAVVRDASELSGEGGLIDLGELMGGVEIETGLGGH